jgi:hypothetical protein
MRHLGTLIVAIVIAPAAWLLIAFGQAQSGTAFAKALTSGAWPAGDFLAPLLLLVGAGLLLGLLASLRFSPLGAVLTGVVFVASYVAVLFDGKDVNKLLNYTVTIAGHNADLRAPVASGASLLLGGVLLVGVASVGRWRRWPAGAPETATTTTDGTGTPDEPTTKDFWTPTTPATSTPTTATTATTGSTGSFAAFGDESAPTERTLPNQFGSPWRTPPGETATEEQAR